LLFLIGLVLNNFPRVWDHWDTWRIMGVPQRLALGYGIASVLVLHFERRWLMWIAGAMLMVYWGLLYFFGVPGADPYALDTNAVLRLDRFLFTDAHLWKGERIPFDPEGVLSTLPAVVTVLLGWFSGGMLERRGDFKDGLVRDLLLWGLALGFAGLFWDLFFPINKKLWTSSYVLYAGGISMLLLAACVWFIDVRGWRNGAGFFLAFGANALFAYVLSEALVMLWADISWTTTAGTVLNVRSWIYQTVFYPLEGGAFSSLLFAVAYTLLCWLFCRWLYVRNIYIKL
jgi:predicted acyltransferase